MQTALVQKSSRPFALSLWVSTDLLLGASRDEAFALRYRGKLPDDDAIFPLLLERFQEVRLVRWRGHGFFTSWKLGGFSRGKGYLFENWAFFLKKLLFMSHLGRSCPDQKVFESPQVAEDMDEAVLAQLQDAQRPSEEGPGESLKLS